MQTLQHISVEQHLASVGVMTVNERQMSVIDDYAHLDVSLWEQELRKCLSNTEIPSMYVAMYFEYRLASSSATLCTLCSNGLFFLFYLAMFSFLKKKSRTGKLLLKGVTAKYSLFTKHSRKNFRH